MGDNSDHGGTDLSGRNRFLIWYNLTHFHFWKKNRIQRGRLRLQTKLALVISVIFIVVMLFFLLATEWNNTLAPYPFGEKLSRSIFQSITPRTAGFNTLPVNKLEPESLWFTNFMMFVGASPSSTGGGIKTTTFAILIAAVYAMVTGKKQVVIGGRSIPGPIVYKVLSIVVISATVVFLASTCLLLTETGICRNPGIPQDYLGCVFFETVSAFGTVGLSTGITPYLSYPGKLIIILTMYVGRVGPLALALWAGSKTTRETAIRYPEESVIVG